MLYSYVLLLGILWLATSCFFFLVAVHVIFPFVVCIWERAGNLKQEDDKGAGRLHP